jgi:hypothetical protein
MPCPVTASRMGAAPVTRLPGRAFGLSFAVPHSPWCRRFAPRGSAAAETAWSAFFSIASVTPPERTYHSAALVITVASSRAQNIPQLLAKQCILPRHPGAAFFRRRRCRATAVISKRLTVRGFFPAVADIRRHKTGPNLAVRTRPGPRCTDQAAFSAFWSGNTTILQTVSRSARHPFRTGGIIARVTTWHRNLRSVGALEKKG